MVENCLGVVTIATIDMSASLVFTFCATSDFETSPLSLVTIARGNCGGPQNPYQGAGISNPGIASVMAGIEGVASKRTDCVSASIFTLPSLNSGRPVARFVTARSI